MPRGVQKSIEDRIAAIQMEIDEMVVRRNNIQSKIDDLEAKKQALLDEQEADKLKEIQQLSLHLASQPMRFFKCLKVHNFSLEPEIIQALFILKFVFQLP